MNCVLEAVNPTNRFKYHSVLILEVLRLLKHLVTLQSSREIVQILVFPSSVFTHLTTVTN